MAGFGKIVIPAKAGISLKYKIISVGQDFFHTPWLRRAIAPTFLLFLYSGGADIPVGHLYSFRWPIPFSGRTFILFPARVPHPLGLVEKLSNLVPHPVKAA